MLGIRIIVNVQIGLPNCLLPLKEINCLTDLLNIFQIRKIKIKYIFNRIVQLVAHTVEITLIVIAHLVSK